MSQKHVYIKECKKKNLSDQKTLSRDFNLPFFKLETYFMINVYNVANREAEMYIWKLHRRLYTINNNQSKASLFEKSSPYTESKNGFWVYLTKQSDPIFLINLYKYHNPDGKSLLRGRLHKITLKLQLYFNETYYVVV